MEDAGSKKPQYFYCLSIVQDMLKFFFKNAYIETLQKTGETGVKHSQDLLYKRLLYIKYGTFKI
jgi:hypothetical protein